MPYPIETVRAIAGRHGLPGEPKLLPDGGMVNEAWQIGEGHILRICRVEDGKDEAAREAAVVPRVIKAGIGAPRLVAVDLTCDIVPMPYTIYEKAEGVLLGYSGVAVGALSEAYREIGREIARLNRVPVDDALRPHLRTERELKPWKTLAKAQAYGVLDTKQGREIADWYEFMEPNAGKATRVCLIHMDIHPWNVFVNPLEDRLKAIIDWGDASLGDPSLEFASMPLGAVPAMLEGYSEEGGEVDEGFVARSLLAGVSLGLWELREVPVKDFERQWWRMPPGGWPEMKELIGRHWPEFVP